MPSSYFVADTIDTYYEDHGDNKSYPLILIHPIGGNILFWHHEISLLLKSGFRVVAYEIRGHYRTNMGRVGAYAMQDLVNDLHKLLEHLNIKKCSIIGHSIGGIIASMYAAQHPESVDAIVLINSSPKYSDLFRDVFTKTSVDGFIAATIALYTIPENVVEKLQTSHCKVFAIVGSDDDVFMRLLKEAKEEIPEMELKVLDGSDHWVIIEKPKELYDILASFLGKIKG